MEIGIEIKITIPPILIFFTPILIPTSDIIPTIKNEILIELNPQNAKDSRILCMRYNIPPIPLRIDPLFLLDFSFSEIKIT